MVLTGKSGLAPLLSIIATTATERLTRIAKAAENPMHIMKHCRCRLPKIGAAAAVNRKENSIKREMVFHR